MRTHSAPLRADQPPSRASSTIATSFHERSWSRHSQASQRSITSSSGQKSTPTSIRIRRLGIGRSDERGLLDTSVVIAPERIGRDVLPRAAAISSITHAELASGPEAAVDACARVGRPERLRHAESAYEMLPFTSVCARAYERIYRAVLLAGRKPRGPRTLDLLLAATALAHDLPHGPGVFHHRRGHLLFGPDAAKSNQTTRASVSPTESPIPPSTGTAGKDLGWEPVRAAVRSFGSWGRRRRARCRRP
jgi:predicted nucleic acid-binding protein